MKRFYKQVQYIPNVLRSFKLKVAVSSTPHTNARRNLNTFSLLYVDLRIFSLYAWQAQGRIQQVSLWGGAGPALADAGPNARPGRGAQCKTYARGPCGQWFYDVIVFSQPCYGRGRAQIYSAALTWELSTFACFANVREKFCWLWRERSLLTMKFICRFYWILYKMNNSTKHHGAGPNAAGSVASA